MNCSSSGWDAFTISAPVLQRIRAVTHCSVERATTRRTTEPTQRTEAKENVTRFHSEGILGAHDAPRRVTRRRIATAKLVRWSPLVYSSFLKKQNFLHSKLLLVTRTTHLMSVSVSHSGGKTESTAVEEISYREKPYLHAVRQTHARASMLVMDYL